MLDRFSLCSCLIWLHYWRVCCSSFASPLSDICVFPGSQRIARGVSNLNWVLACPEGLWSGPFHTSGLQSESQINLHIFARCSSLNMSHNRNMSPILRVKKKNRSTKATTVISSGYSLSIRIDMDMWESSFHRRIAFPLRPLFFLTVFLSYNTEICWD